MEVLISPLESPLHPASSPVSAADSRLVHLENDDARSDEPPPDTTPPQNQRIPITTASSKTAARQGERSIDSKRALVPAKRMTKATEPVDNPLAADEQPAGRGLTASGSSQSDQTANSSNSSNLQTAPVQNVAPAMPLIEATPKLGRESQTPT